MDDHQVQPPHVGRYEIRERLETVRWNAQLRDHRHMVFLLKTHL